MPDPALLNLEMAISRILDAAPHILPDWSMKQRDKREPGKREKEAVEERLARAVLRLFRRQREKIRERIEFYAPERKAVQIPIDTFDDVFEPDDDMVAELYRILFEAEKHGIELFGANKPAIDYSLVNTRAANWARDYSYDLVKDINKTSRQALRDAISGFVETPGMTIRDIMDLLPYDEQRAMTVAVTETTRAYAEAHQLAGRELAKEFPGVPIIKTWYTNNDDRVCEICYPLNGMEVDIEDGFSTEEGEGIMTPPAHVNCRCWIETTTALADLEEEKAEWPKIDDELSRDEVISYIDNVNPPEQVASGRMTIDEWADKYLSDDKKYEVIQIDPRAANLPASTVTEKVESFAKLPQETSPPIVIDSNNKLEARYGGGKLEQAYGRLPDIVIDGKHRVEAAIARGDEIISAIVPDNRVDDLIRRSHALEINDFAQEYFKDKGYELLSIDSNGYRVNRLGNIQVYTIPDINRIANYFKHEWIFKPGK